MPPAGWQFRLDWARAAEAETAPAFWEAELVLALAWESAWAGLRTLRRPAAMPATTATSAASRSTPNPDGLASQDRGWRTDRTFAGTLRSPCVVFETSSA